MNGEEVKKSKSRYIRIIQFMIIDITIIFLLYCFVHGDLNS